MAQYKRLYRSRSDRMLGGVCGGLGEYLEVDPTVIRLLFVAAAFMGGPGLIAYLIMWMIIPEAPFGRHEEQELQGQEGRG
jgi:phage shock protein PspC (stress-responsive transcriptional regulator)